MWEVSDVEPVRVMGAEGYPCRILKRNHQRQVGRLICLCIPIICLCIPSPCRGGRNTSGIGSAERNFGSSLLAE